MKPQLSIVRSNDVRDAQTQMEKSLITATAPPRRKCLWGLRLYIKVLTCGEVVPPDYCFLPGETVPDAWHTYSTGGIVRYASQEAAEAFGAPLLRNTGDWRVTKLPWWLAAYDSFMWLVIYSRKRK